jgi:lipoate-protein ligase A
MNRACYGTLSPYEVVVGQRKVVGLDMIRRRAGSLLQAGVLLHWDTATLARLLGHTEEEQALLYHGLKERAVGLDTLADRSIGIEETIQMFESVVAAIA